MEANVTYGDVGVEITLTTGEVLSLERNGEVLAHPPDPAPRVCITTDEETFDSYYYTDNATAVMVGDDELMALAGGEMYSISWMHGRDGTPEEPHVRLRVA